MFRRPYIILEIKPFGLGSRIRDMEAEWRLKVITDLISWIFGKQNWHFGMNWTGQSVRGDIMFLASTATEVKNDHAHVITQGICYKYIELNFCVRCMVSQPNRL